MNDSAAFLVDHVLPQQPVRSWICTLPWELRYLAGYDQQLAGELVGAFVNSVLDSLRRRAKRVLRRRGLLDGNRLDADGCADPLQTAEPALAHCYDAAVRGIEQFGKRTGQPTLRLLDPAAATDGHERTVAAVTVGGFNRPFGPVSGPRASRDPCTSTPAAPSMAAIGSSSSASYATLAARRWPSTGSNSYPTAACATA